MLRTKLKDMIDKHTNMREESAFHKEIMTVTKVDTTSSNNLMSHAIFRKNQFHTKRDVVV